MDIEYYQGLHEYITKVYIKRIYNQVYNKRVACIYILCLKIYYKSIISEVMVTLWLVASLEGYFG